MLNSARQERIALEALEWYGKTAQCVKTIEELAELQKAIAKWLNSFEEKEIDQCTNIVEEIADCYIMLYQMTVGFENYSTKSVDTFINQKIDRLYERIEEEKERDNA